MPLASPVRAVTCRAKIVAERRHSVGIEPEDVPVPGLVAPSTHRLGGPMQRRVMAGEDGRPRRDAGGGRHIVALELNPIGAQLILKFEIVPAELLRGLGLVDRREAHLVAKEDQEVRRFAS